MTPAAQGSFATHSYWWCSGNCFASGKPMTHTLDFAQPFVCSHCFMSRIARQFGGSRSQLANSTRATKPNTNRRSTIEA